MDIRLLQYIYLKDDIKNSVMVFKDIDSSFVPRVGDYIMDTAFMDPYEYEVRQVLIDYDTRLCSVTLDMLEIKENDKKALKDIAEIYKLHGWDYDDYQFKKV